jgi:dTDP-4-amino-4,6-dideoxygalactose transaminase
MNNSVPFVDLKAEYLEMKSEIDQAVHRILDSGWFILGPELEKFESEFSEFCGAKYVVGVGSGTDAIYLALKALGVGPGDEVITVSHSFIATALAITFTGATPVFVDVDPDAYTLDPQCARAAITPRTKVLLPVHLYGQTANMSELMRLAETYHLAVVEDACQAHGAKYKGQSAGAIGHIGCFSFYPTKNLGAYGDGGAVVTNDPQLADRLTALRNYGQEKKYYHASIGTNSRLDEMQAAVLRVKLGHLEMNNQRRRQVAAAYAPLNRDFVHIPVEAPDCTHIYYVYVVRVSERDALQVHLKNNGVGTLVHYPIPIHRQQAYAEINKIVTDMPITERIADEVLSLPMYSQLSLKQVGDVIKLVNDFFEPQSDRSNL